jgi:Mrp family chromosome partitioning ATPase
MANCNSCPSKNNCSSQQKENCGQTDFHVEANALSQIKRVIPVVSGKGGVGKSSITAMLAVLMRRKGYRTAILDADITGPSIPRMFGLKAGIKGDHAGIYPAKTHNDISVMSVNLLLEQEDQPVVWRGPVIAGTVKQFWSDVVWEDVDYMFIDMPPGTGDVPLTIFQSLPVDGIIIATSPQELVSVIVKKAVNMAVKMNIEIAGIVENMSYVLCPDCGKKIDVFGTGKVEETAKSLGIDLLGKIPMDIQISGLCDNGEIEKFTGDYLDHCVEMLERKYPV